MKSFQSTSMRIVAVNRLCRRDSKDQRIEMLPRNSSTGQETPYNEPIEGDFVFEKLMLDRLLSSHNFFISCSFFDSSIFGFPTFQQKLAKAESHVDQGRHLPQTNRPGPRHRLDSARGNRPSRWFKRFPSKTGIWSKHSVHVPNLAISTRKHSRIKLDRNNHSQEGNGFRERL
jgi:hypothetical protein